MSEPPRQGPKGLALLNLGTWIRQHAWLGACYRLLPLSWRVGAARLLDARANAGVRFPKTAAWERPLASAWQPAVPAGPAEGTLGANIVGYVRGQFGLAESARMYARALMDAGVQVRLFDVDLGLPHGWNDRSLEAWIDEDLPFPVSFVFVNPDYLQQALEVVGREKLKGKRVIACWFWELERVPDAWLPAIAQVDEIMVATRFIENAFRHVTDKPILRVPQPLGEVVDSGLQRVDFGLEEDVFVFLVTFDFNSWIERKNPFAAVEAFRRAFPPQRRDVRLLLKSSNGFRYREPFQRLLNIAAADPRILVRDEIIDRAHVHALQRCCDAYVSLHRAEGFGLGLAECMAMGKPVIGTGWSGNMDFMDARNSCPVGYRMVPVAADAYPGGAGAEWAEPDIDQAAIYMRRLVDEPGLAAALGQQAAHDIQQSNAPAVAGRLIRERLRQLETQPRHKDNEHMGDAA